MSVSSTRFWRCVQSRASFFISCAFILFFVSFMLPMPAFSQGATPGSVSDAPEVAGKTDMWLSVSSWVLFTILGGIFLAILGKILRIYELSNEVNGKPKPINWNNVNGIAFLVFMILGFAGVIWELNVHGRMGLQDSASLHGQTTDTLFHVTTVIIGIVFFMTNLLLFGYAFMYKHNKQRQAFFYPENNKLEQAWTIAPAIVLATLVIFGFAAWRDITGGKELVGKTNVVTVELTGEQWKWWARYPGADGVLGRKDYRLIQGGNVLGIDFKDRNAADDVVDKQGDTIVLPVNHPIKLVLGAKDVIHSAYMPYFRVQMNCVPGLPTYFYFTPIYTTDEMRAKLNVDTFNYVLLCAKICGASHYNMGRVVRVVNERQYNLWKSHLKPWYSIPANREQIKLTENRQKAGITDINKKLAYSSY